MTEYEALKAAINKVGSQSALAKAVGVAQQTVFYWVHTSKKASPTYAIKIEQATGISRHELAPKMYPREGHAA